jgi:phenylalanyl-tRNA synthetase beta chain
MGELHPLVRERLEIEATRVAIAEINLEPLIAHVRPDQYTPISRYPAVVQDLALIVDNAVPAERVTALIRQGGGDLLEHVTLFDVYTGAQVEAGKRSLAYRLSFRAYDRTLNDEAVAKQRARIVRLLERELDARLRG